MTAKPEAAVTGAREHLIAALEADLIDPYEGAEAFATSTERLRLPPSRWRLAFTSAEGRSTR